MKGIAYYLFNTLCATALGISIATDDAHGIGLFLFGSILSLCLIIIHHRYDH